MKSLLVIGKNGQLGSELVTALSPLGKISAVGRAEMDLADPDGIRKTLRAIKPDVIINAAAYTAVDKAESEPGLAMQINGVAPGIMAEEAQRLNALLVHYSTDYVFDGAKATPYLEDDEPRPLSVYGKSKLEGEKTVTATGCRHLILRTSWVYSATGNNFVLNMLRLGKEKETLSVVDDQIGSPTWARPLATTTAELLGKHLANPAANGIFHLAASGHVSRYALAGKIFSIARQLKGDGIRAKLIPTTTALYPLPAVRPLNAAMNQDKVLRMLGIKMDPWDTQLAVFLKSILT